MRKDWEYKKLGEIAFYPNDKISVDKIESNHYVGVENLLKDKAGILFSDQLPNATTATRFKYNDILLGNIRPYLKKIWLSNIEGGASGDVIVIRSSSDNILPNYLFKLLSSDKFFDYFNLYTKGAKMPRGDKNAIAKFIVPIPPKSTQLSIVAELDKLNEMIRLKKQQLEDYDQLAQSIFYEMFGDPILNEKGWEVKKLGEISTIERGSGISKKDFCNSGLPCIHYGQIHTSFGAYTKEVLSYIPENLLPKYKYASRGDLIMAITSEDVEGSCKSTTWLGNYDVVIGSDAAICHHSQDGIYLSYYTRTKAFYNEKAKYAKGFKVTHISTKEIASIPIPLPPLPLQQQFAARIEAIEQQKQQVKDAIKDLETLLASRMQYWFDFTPD